MIQQKRPLHAITSDELFEGQPDGVSGSTTVIEGEGGGSTSVPVDNITIERNSSLELAVKDEGISTDQLADEAVTAAKLADSGVVAGAYPGRLHTFTISDKGLVTVVEDIQCTSWHHEDSQTAGSLVIPPAGSEVALTFPTIVICNPAFTGDPKDRIDVAADIVASMQFYWRGTPPGGWAAAEVIMDLYRWNAAGPGWAFVTELGRDYASATPIPPNLAINGSITTKLLGATGDYYQVKLRQTGIAPQTFVNWYCRWTGSFIDAGACVACTG